MEDVEEAVENVDIDYEQALQLVEEGESFIEEYGGLVESIPYAKQAVTAFKWVRRKRIESFLSSLNRAADELSEEERKRFEEVINSNAGGKILAEFSDTVLKTSSEKAISALALLYADCDERKYSKKFKASACLALEGISDDQIEVFLEMAAIEDHDEGTGPDPYPVYFADKLEDHLPRLKELAPTLADKTMYMSELTRRGMLLPDHSTGRYGGPKLSYGIGDRTRQYRDLLNRATEFLEED